MKNSKLPKKMHAYHVRTVSTSASTKQLQLKLIF